MSNHTNIAENNPAKTIMDGQPQLNGSSPADENKKPAIRDDVGPLSDRVKAVRPGVSNRTLRENGITLTDAGPGDTWGFKIPYHYFSMEAGATPVPMSNDDGSNFCRERYARPKDGRKYTQAAGTEPHVYFPRGVAELIVARKYLIITEGEVKALALCEAGYPAIGIGGFYSFQSGGTLLPEIIDLFDELDKELIKLEAIYFLGDADTSINFAFPAAAVRMRELLSQNKIDAQLRLPRMPIEKIDTEKGIDDARFSTKDFCGYMDNLLHETVEVRADTRVEDLTYGLFVREKEKLQELIAAAEPEKRGLYCRRLAGITNHVDAAAVAEITAFAIEAKLVPNKTAFKDARKKAQRKFEEELAEKNRTKICRVKIYYAPFNRAKYLYKTPFDEFTSVDRQSVSNYLAMNGYSKSVTDGKKLSEVDGIITAAENWPYDWAGAVGGQKPGDYDSNGQRVLVTRGPDLVHPIAGYWATIRAFMTLKLDYDPAQDTSEEKKAEHAKAQSPYVLGWLSQAVRALYVDGKEKVMFDPSQALGLCGRAGVGKNVLQDIVTEILGKRTADPFTFMDGASSFNGELVEAEHWMVADQQSSLRNSDKDKFKAAIKQVAVNRLIHVNGKHAKPINIESYRRLTISLNDDPDALRVLPSLSSDFEDKLIILHVLPGDFFGEGTQFPDYRAWWGQVQAELPAFVNYLLKEHVILPEHASVRYGVASYHDAEILARINAQSVEARFRDLVIWKCFTRPQELWEGTAGDMFTMINDPAGLREFGISSPVKVGTFLSRLCDQEPETFSKRMLEGKQLYRITRPADMPIPVSKEKEVQPLTGKIFQMTRSRKPWDPLPKGMEVLN